MVVEMKTTTFSGRRSDEQPPPANPKEVVVEEEEGSLEIFWIFSRIWEAIDKKNLAGKQNVKSGGRAFNETGKKMRGRMALKVSKLRKLKDVETTNPKPVMRS